MKTAFLLPGQGVFFQPDLLQWMTESVRVQKHIFYTLDLLGMKQTDLQPGHGSHLNQTQILQPILTALLVGIYE